jgi:GT2 family glycosyltransferase
MYVPTAVVRHVGSAVSGRHSDFTTYHGHRNLVWVYFKNMPGALLWLYLPQHVLLNLVECCVFLARDQGRTILRAKLDAAKGLTRVWGKRRKVQAARKCQVADIMRAMRHGWPRRT